MKIKAKMPPKLVALSMCAMVFFVGSLAVVSFLDTEASVDLENRIDIGEPFFIGFDGWYSDGTRGTFEENPNFFVPSENGGTYMLDASGFVSADKTINKLRVYVGKRDVRSPLLDAEKIIIMTSVAVSSISFQALESGVSNLHFVQNPDVPGVWELEFSSAQQLMLHKDGVQAQNLYFNFSGDNVFPADGLIEFSIEAYGNPIPLYYSEIIVAIIGVVLILVGLFVSPFLSTDDLKKWANKGKRAMRGGN